MSKFFNFFHVELLSYEESHSFFFVGPAHHTPDSFKEICDKNLPDATLKAVANFNNSPIEEYASLSMVDIFDKLEGALALEGFTRIQPKSIFYSGSGGRVDDREAEQLGIASDTALYHSSNILSGYDFDEETGDRRPY
jgi:hypothetical protein